MLIEYEINEKEKLGFGESAFDTRVKIRMENGKSIIVE